MTSRLSIVFKVLRQLGLTQVILYSLYKIGLQTGHYKRAERRKRENRQPFFSLHSLITLPDLAQLQQTLGQDAQPTLLAEADEIVTGKFRMFGGEPVEIKLAFDQPLHHWTGYETHKVPTPDSQFTNSDIKFIWEPARFGWAYTLGRAYHLTQDETYAGTFWKYFERFTDANPS
jgi:hypothetical protein